MGDIVRVGRSEWNCEERGGKTGYDGLADGGHGDHETVSRGKCTHWLATNGSELANLLFALGIQ